MTKSIASTYNIYIKYMKKSPSDRKQVHKNIEKKKEPKKSQCVNRHNVILHKILLAI